MLISASRRTDIPSCYSEWFYHRLKEGYVCVRNPMNPHQVSKINLSPEIVDGIVFWTKNPLPMMDRLGELEKYNYYFQFTLTAYGPEVETNLPSKNKVLIPAFQRLSKEIGKERVVWRYDPIFFSERYTLDYHCRYFEVLASRLAPYTEKCTISFLDWYRNIEHDVKPLQIQTMTGERQTELVERLAEIAERYHISIDTCAEAGDFRRFKVFPACCIDKTRLERIGNYRLDIGKDKNQREYCGCAESIDIGAYQTCKNGCLYCYANFNHGAAERNFEKHKIKSSLLLGEIEEADKITERNAKSFADRQLVLHGIEG